jgi:hypothetical protein
MMKQINRAMLAFVAVAMTCTAADVSNHVFVVSISNPPYKGTGHYREMSRQLDNRVRVKQVSTNRVITSCSCGGCIWAFQRVTFHTNLTATLLVAGSTKTIRIGDSLTVDREELNVFDIQPYWGLVVLSRTNAPRLKLQGPRQKESSNKILEDTGTSAPDPQD